MESGVPAGAKDEARVNTSVISTLETDEAQTVAAQPRLRVAWNSRGVIVLRLPGWPFSYLQSPDQDYSLSSPCWLPQLSPPPQ